jgi:hypothetical protein
MSLVYVISTASSRSLSGAVAQLTAATLYYVQRETLVKQSALATGTNSALSSDALSGSS